MTATTDAGAKSAKAPEKKKGLLRTKKGLLIVVLLLAAVGYGGYTFMAPAKAGPPVAGEVVPLEPTTLNLKAGHYLKIALGIQLVEGKATVEEFKTSEAAELVIDEFSDRTVEAVSSNEARKKLVEDLEKKIKAAYEGEVFAIFLTQFVTQ